MVDADRSRVEAVRTRLKALRATIQDQLSQSQQEWTQELSSYDNHPADDASTTFRRELDAGLETGLEHRLWEADRALEKIEAGTYGLCDRCGRPIGAGRLRARPESVLCVRCAAAVETPYVPPPPGTEKVPVPYGRLNAREPVEPVGSDFWQEVAQWGTSDSPQDVPPAVDYEETLVGFDEPQGTVEAVERFVDENGEPLLDAVREDPRRHARSTSKEDDDIPSS
jgi:DnaK suppressor protein